jgi:anti-anti-sigma regulatory factor
MLQVREQQQIKVLALTGQFNRDDKTDIQLLILGAKEMGCHHIILDFSGVTEIDSTCLSELLLWYPPPATPSRRD